VCRRRPCVTQRHFLKVTKSTGYINESVTDIELTYGVSAGIQWGAIGVGMVPIFEEHSARLERGYTIDNWRALDSMERAIVIAVRRVDIASKNLQAEAEIRKTNREMNKPK